MSEIINEVKRIIEKVNKDGIEINGTKEIQNEINTFFPNNYFNINNEEKEIELFYNKQIGNWKERQKLEKSHYSRLTADILHEITRGQYFSNLDKYNGMSELIDRSRDFLDGNKYNKLTKERNIIKKDYDKLNNFSGRRNLIFSQDCISLVQFVCRDKFNLLNVYIRSSDTVNLLLADYLFGIKLLDKILTTFKIKKNIDDRVTFIIGSTHFYLKDQNIVNKIIKNDKL